VGRCAAISLIGVCLLSACAAPAPAVPTTTPLPQPTASPIAPTPAPVVVQPVRPQPAPRPAAEPRASPAAASLPLSILAGRSGADLRVSLDALLEEDAFLSAMALQAASDARLDEQIGITSMLDQNASTLAGIVGALKGQTAAQALATAWRAQATDLVAYAHGQPGSVDAHRAAVADNLATGDFSPVLAMDALQRRYQAEQMLAGSASAHDAANSALQLASLLAASDDLGHPLARAMAAQLPDLLSANTEGGDVDVRLHLASGFTARLLLTAAAAGAAADGRSAQAQAYAAAADSVTADLGGQLNAAFGSDVGSGVADRLRAQTAAYVAAAQQQDRPQAAADIDHLRGEIDGLLSGADLLLAPRLLSQQQRASDQPLLSAADAFAARDFASAYARVHEAVRQAQKPAETLALAIIDRYPARYLVLATPTPTR
jgi:hypothetical protein